MQEHDSLLSAVAEWETAVAKKWTEVRRSKGHFISVYTPSWTLSEDQRRRNETSIEVKRWSEQWFKQRGHQVECHLLPDGESIAISKVESL